MKRLFIGFLLFSACASAPPAAKVSPPPIQLNLSGNLASRIENLAPQASDFFYAPETEFDRALYQTGLYHHWQFYGKTPSPVASDFTGYILLSDPYHRGNKKISFLLGSDCSNFVHRVFQTLGAEFRFMKTRHWIHLAKAKKSKNPKRYYSAQNRTDTPIDLKRCEWDHLLTQFVLIENPNEIKLGDVIVYPKSEGILGTKGHMGFVSKTNPVSVLQSKYKVGIVELPLEFSEFYILRWNYALQPVQASGVKELLDREYDESPTGGACR